MMAEWLLRELADNFFLINIVILTVFFSCKLNKRRLYGLRLAAGIVICLILGASLDYRKGALSSVLSFIIPFLMVVLLSFFTYAISFVEALYATACAYAVQHIAYGIYRIVFQPADGVPIYSCGYLSSFVVIAVLYYIFIGRKLPENGRYPMNLRFSLWSLGIILFLVLGLSVIAGDMFNQSHNELYYVCLGYDVICCIFVLWEQMDYRRKMKL